MYNTPSFFLPYHNNIFIGKSLEVDQFSADARAIRPHRPKNASVIRPACGPKISLFYGETNLFAKSSRPDQ